MGERGEAQTSGVDFDAMSSPAGAASGRRRLAGPALGAAAVLACLAAGELFARSALRDRLRTTEDERSLTYRHDSTLGWFPREGSRKKFTGGRTVEVRHNAMGFRDAERGAKRGPRLAVVGDSFVWGYDVEAEERFGEKLEKLLPGWEVLNLGVSGYGTDQEYLLSRRWLPELRPDVVFLFYSLNDSRDNATNFRYGAYPKPYFVKEGGALVLRGVPVPKSLASLFGERPLLFRSYLARAVAAALRAGSLPQPLRVPDLAADLLLAERALVESLGGRFAMAFVERHKGLQAFCEERGVPYLDFSDAQQYPELGHWTPAGHGLVAERMAAFLRERGWLPPPAVSAGS